jgi:hypothetical protein
LWKWLCFENKCSERFLINSVSAKPALLSEKYFNSLAVSSTFLQYSSKLNYLQFCKIRPAKKGKKMSPPFLLMLNPGSGDGENQDEELTIHISDPQHG